MRLRGWRHVFAAPLLSKRKTKARGWLISRANSALALPHQSLQRVTGNAVAATLRSSEGTAAAPTWGVAGQGAVTTNGLQVVAFFLPMQSMSARLESKTMRRARCVGSVCDTGHASGGEWRLGTVNRGRRQPYASAALDMLWECRPCSSRYWSRHNFIKASTTYPRLMFFHRTQLQ